MIEIRKKLAVESWSNDTMKSFVSTMVRGFLRNDLYNCLIEFLSRAEGSFGKSYDTFLCLSLSFFQSHTTAFHRSPSAL